MVSVTGLSKKYGAFTAIDDISFEIKKGEVVGLLGPNGAGKTTTMKILTCYLQATAGVASVDNLNVLEDSIGVRDKIGYLPESAPLYQDMTVAEYLRFAGEIRGLSGDKLKQRLIAVLEDCGLKERVHQSISELSKGYKQRVGLAQALISDPQLLILDEPTVGLDPNQIVEIRELIKKVGKEKTVILSSHILAEVEATCDRVLIINKGKIVATGTPQELRDSSKTEAQILLKVEKTDGRDPESILKSLNGAEKVVSNKSHEPNTLIFEIHVEKGKDLRAEIINKFQQEKIQVLELTRKEMKLEDIFAQLTKTNS